MNIDITVPSPGESITEVQVATWLVADGEYVEKDSPVVGIAVTGNQIIVQKKDGTLAEFPSNGFYNQLPKSG